MGDTERTTNWNILLWNRNYLVAEGGNCGDFIQSCSLFDNQLVADATLDIASLVATLLLQWRRGSSPCRCADAAAAAVASQMFFWLTLQQFQPLSRVMLFVHRQKIQTNLTLNLLSYYF